MYATAAHSPIYLFPALAYRAQFSRGLKHRLDIWVFLLFISIGFQRMAAALFVSATPAYTHRTISSYQNRLGFSKSLQITSLRDYHTVCRSHAARFPYHDEDLLCNGRASVYKEFAGYLNRVWMQRSMANKYYEKAMELEPCNHHIVREYAEFVSEELRDVEKAEEIYEQALQECPVDVDLVGGFACFLWETEK